MSKQARKLYMIPVIALLASSTTALADDPGSDWMSMEEVISVLKENGYSEISEIEADDGHWEGEGMKDGERYEFHVNPQTGELTKDERDDG